MSADGHYTHAQDYTSLQKQGVSRLVYSDDLFDKWPPPVEMEGRLNQNDIEQIKAEMRGQPMCGIRPNSKELEQWGLTCAEQYHIYDLYWCW